MQTYTSWSMTAPPELPTEVFVLVEKPARAGRHLPAWLVSAILHMAFLVILGTIFYELPQQVHSVLVTEAVEVVELEEPPPELQRFRFSDELSADIGSQSVMGIDIPASTAPELAKTTELPTEISPQQDAELYLPLLFDLATAPTEASTLIVAGSAGEGAIGTEGAVDRITQEILLSLEQRRTLVVWLFDQSLSMQAQRDLVNERFYRVYEELGLSHLVAANSQEKPLLTSVISFGEKVNFLTPQPTDDLRVIREAVSSISNDPSGIEMTFTALGMAAQKYQSHRVQHGRNVMLIAFSDEVGDDPEHLGALIKICQRNAMPVYVVGVPAPFGRDEVDVRFVDPDPAFSQDELWLPVRQGPESLLPEGVRLGFSGRNNPLDELYRLDSGFGPYSLSRLCYETGGIYFAVHPGRPETAGFVPTDKTPVMSARLNYFFDPNVMRSYRPDYMSADEYRRKVMNNKAKAALVEAARLSQVMVMESPRLEFINFGDNEAALKQAFDDAQKPAAILEPRLNAIYAVMKLGEEDRAKLTEPRWQAGYDLAMGRILAAKVRTEAYNAMIAKAKVGMRFADPRNNTWRLQPENEITVGSVLERQARQARELLQRVVDQHPGTPWALLAAEELKEPVGWQWTESFTQPPPPPPPPGPPAPPANNPPPAPSSDPPPEENADPPPPPQRPNIRL